MKESVDSFIIVGYSPKDIIFDIQFLVTYRVPRKLDELNFIHRVARQRLTDGNFI